MCLFGLRPLHLCGTRLEGGHQGLSLRYGWVRGEPQRGAGVGVGRSRNTRAMRKPLLVAGCRIPSSRLRLRLRLRACVPADDAAARLSSAHANLRVRESLRCPPSRRVPHKWSGRRPNKNTGRAAAFLFERGGLSEQRGWAPKALRLNPPRKPRLELAAASQGDASTRSPMNRLLRGREGVA